MFFFFFPQLIITSTEVCSCTCLLIPYVYLTIILALLLGYKPRALTLWCRMSIPDETILTGELPGLTNVPLSTLLTAAPTPAPTSQQPPQHVTTFPPKMTTDPDFAKLHSSLTSNSLTQTTISAIPKLTGNKNYTFWSNKVIGVM